jgi:sphinganine C4-monooxygenase
MSSLASSSELVAPVLAPIGVYWIAAGLYSVLGADKYRLHSREEEEMKNLVPKRVFIRVVLLQHLTQAAIAFAFFTVSTPSSIDATLSFRMICKQIYCLKLTQVTRDGPASTTGAAPAIIVHSCQFIVAMAVFDTWQYFWHRLMHSNRFLYRHVHSWHHRLVVPYSYAAQYNHPAESLILDTVGGALMLAVSGMSPWTSACFFCWSCSKFTTGYWPGF